MRVQCSCGAAYVGFSASIWWLWQSTHTCTLRDDTGSSEAGTAPTEGEYERLVDLQASSTERSFGLGGYYDGDRFLPDIQASRPVSLRAPQSQV